MGMALALSTVIPTPSRLVCDVDRICFGFMPRPEPIHLGTPWGATFFGVLTGLPAWIIAKLMVGNDFVHGLKFHVSLTKKLSCPGTNTCCAKTVAGRDVSFFDVLYGILHDKLSRSLLTPRSGARVVPPSAAIEQFVQSTLLWHGATDPLIVERGESFSIVHVPILLSYVKQV